MARLARLFIPDVPAHVIVRGNNRQSIFRSDGDRIFFHRCLVELARESHVRVHAYVLMTNHVHLLATGEDAQALPALFVRLGRRYVPYFNHLHGRTGSLWEGRYRSAPVERERYFLICQQYIELNPVRAGIVCKPADFPWSSHRHHAEGIRDDLVTAHELVENLGEDPEARRAAYRRLFEEMLAAEELDRIRDSVRGGWVLGSPGFMAELERRGTRRPAPLPLGRPRRNEPKPA